METASWIQLLLFVGLLLLLTRPLGAYLYRVLESRQKTFFSPVIGGCEKWLLKALGRGSEKEQSWKQYGAALACFSLAGMLLTYFILRLQHFLPLNPQHLRRLDPSLAFNTAASFASNTNWQNYAGESTMSHFSQMVGLTFQNFVSAAAGIAVAAALVRGIVRKTARTIGNFWVDLVRVTLHVLLPVVVPPGSLFHLPGRDPEFPAGCQRVLPGNIREPGACPAHPPGARCLPGGDQGPGHQRRGLFQRQFGPPFRKPDPVEQFCPDAGHPR